MCCILDRYDTEIIQYYIGILSVFWSFDNTISSEYRYNTVLFRYHTDPKYNTEYGLNAFTLMLSAGLMRDSVPKQLFATDIAQLIHQRYCDHLQFEAGTADCSLDAVTRAVFRPRTFPFDTGCAEEEGKWMAVYLLFRGAIVPKVRVRVCEVDVPAA